MDFEVREGTVSWVDPEHPHKGKIRDDETGREYEYSKENFRLVHLTLLGAIEFGSKKRGKDKGFIPEGLAVAYTVMETDPTRAGVFTRVEKWREALAASTARTSSIFRRR